MGRRFQDPTAGSAPELQMLKKPAMIFVCRPQILTKKPGAIRRHIVHRIELIAQERGSHKADALLRNFCTHGVHVAKRWHEPIKELTTLRCALNSPFLVDESRGRWRSYFPHKRRPMLGIRGEESVQYAGAAARQSYDKERFADFLTRNVWIKLPVTFHLQTRAQRLQNVDSQGNFSDQAEPCLVVA